MIWQESVSFDDPNLAIEDNFIGISVTQTIKIIDRDDHNLIMIGGTKDEYENNDINLYAPGFLLGMLFQLLL